MPAKRKRVDWDEEIRKTEKIRRRGLLMSALSFVFALVFIFGISRHNGIDVKIPKTVLFAALFFVSCVVFGLILKFRNKKSRKNEENEEK